MLFAFVVLNILTIVYALPYGHSIQNLNTVMLKCPGGHLWANGGCRDAHYLIRTALSPLTSDWQISDLSNFVTVPPNCPPGQEYGNGACRDPFRNVIYKQLSDLSNFVTVPPNCPPGQEYGNGACRDPFRNVIYKQLSDLSNFVTVPPNCPPGQEYGNGACRDPFRNVIYKNILLLKKHPENLFHDYIRQILQNRIGLLGNSNVINSFPRITSVPRQCPLGTRLDAEGRCRQRILL